MTPLHLSLLGTFALHDNGRPVDLTIGKVQAMLAYLAMNTAPIPREQLLALLWAESHPDAARKNLRNRLWQLRQLTAEEIVITKGEMIALAPAVQSDVVTFIAGIQTHLATAPVDPSGLRTLLTLWRGPLLDGLQLSEAPEFELWLSRERERLGQLHRQALESLIGAHAEKQEWEEVITLAHQGLLQEPLHEPLYQQLMVAYTRQGRRAEAIRQYDQLHKLLATELAVPPLPATEALREAIISGKEEQPATGNRSLQSKPTVSQRPPSLATSKAPPTLKVAPYRSVQPFIGRAEQLGLLQQQLAESARGVCRVVLLAGELGMGKTSLWQQWASQQSATAVVLETLCLNTTQPLPFAPMRRLLSSVRCREHLTRLAAQLLPTWRAELMRLAPQLQLPSADVGIPGEEKVPEDAVRAPARLSPTEERGVIAEALTQFLRAFGGAPLILFIDDLHWADDATLDWLRYLTDRMADEPLLLIGAYRPEDAPTTLTRLMAQWQRVGVLQRIELPHFTAEETERLLIALGTANTAFAYLHQQSGGNPYYLTQLSDVAVDGIPASLAELVRARLSYLDERWQPVLQAAAILEPTIDLDLLSHTSGQDEETVVDALDALLAASILEEQNEHYAFTHPLVATVMRDGLSSGRRKLLHRRAAEGILARYHSDPIAVAGQLAHHFTAADQQGQAAHFATIAGDEALRIGAGNEAVAFYRQALALAPTPERQLGLGKALMLLPGRSAEARQAMEAALTAYEAARNCWGTITAGLRLAASFLGTQESAQVLYWAQRVLPDVETVDDPTLHASVHYLLGTAKFRSGAALTEAEGHYRAATKIADEYDLDAEVTLMIWFEWGNLCIERGDYNTASEKFRQVHQRAVRRQSPYFEALSLNNQAYATLLMGASTDAQALMERAVALTEIYGLPAVQYYLLSTSGEIALATGALDQAEKQFTAAILLAEKYDNHTFVANLQAHLGRVEWARGHLSKAEQLLQQAKAALTPGHGRFLQIQIDLWLATVMLEAQQFVDAATCLGNAEERLAATEYRALQLAATQLHSQLHMTASAPQIEQG